jgi:hypothetical protein
MADDDAGGTVLGFPGLRIPGPVGSGPPPPGAGAPSLAPLPTLAPPPSLMVADNPDLSGGNSVAVNADPGMPDASERPGIAAMSVVMMAGITVAAMRGAWNAAAYLKARHEHHRAIADQQRAAADKAALGVEMARQKGRVQSGPEFGRSTRTAGGGARTNSGKNSTPGTFRSSGGPKPSGGSGPKTPSKTSGGSPGGRTGTPGTSGRGGGSGGRRGTLESSGTKGGGKTGTRGGKTGTGSLSGAVRDRAADRIRNGPKPKTPTSGTDGKGKDTKPDRGPRIRDAARARVADRITTGSWTPTGRKPADLAKGSGSSSTPTTIRGALRHRAVDRILNGKKGKDDPANPDGPKVDLTKKLKPTSGSGGSGGSSSTPKVDLTKKPKPKPGSGGASGTGGAAPKVNLRKKVNLKKKRRKSGSDKAGGSAGGTDTGTTGPKSTGPTGTGPTGTGPKAGKSRSRRDRWERAGARRSERASDGPPGSPGTATGPGPAAGADGGFGPPPGWGHAKGWEFTGLERTDSGPGSQVRRRPAGAITRGRPGLPAGTSKGAAPVTVPVPTKAPNTQYADSDLTIYDVIDSDADMAEEITAGADDARQAAEGCESLITRLEALHAKVQELKVPGVLEGWVLLLVEKAMNVKARAEAVAEKIPAASEAIAQAGHNAEERHKHPADVTRDHGHAAPAEREYHNE